MGAVDEDKLIGDDLTQAYSEKENPSAPNKSRTYGLPIAIISSDELYFELPSK